MPPGLDERFGGRLPDITALPPAMQQQNGWVIAHAMNVGAKGYPAKAFEFPFVH